MKKIICMIAVMITACILINTGVYAADSEIVCKKKSTGEFKGNYSIMGNITIDFTSKYPVFSIKGNKKATKAMNNTIYSQSVIEPNTVLGMGYNLYGILEDTDATVELLYKGAARRGNLYSTSFSLQATAPDTIPVNVYKVLTFNLKNGAAISNESELFKNPDKAATYIAKKCIKLSNKYKAEFESGKSKKGFFMDGVTADDVKKLISVGNIRFDKKGITVIFDETKGLSAHAAGVIEMTVSYKDIKKYLTAETIKILAL